MCASHGHQPAQQMQGHSRSRSASMDAADARSVSAPDYIGASRALLLQYPHAQAYMRALLPDVGPTARGGAMCLCTAVRIWRWRAALALRALFEGRDLPARLKLRQDSLSVASPATPPIAQSGTQDNRSRKRLLLVRHGQTTYNVEGRLPGQIPGVSLTDEGRRQAHRAAIALSAVPITAVISSPLERARDTAEIIARGWDLPVRLDDRLKDTDVARWAGQKVHEVAKSDPEWQEFVRHANYAPPGVESLSMVMERVVAAAEYWRYDPSTGDNVVLVAHADVVKLIAAHYLGLQADCAHSIHIDNASITALSFSGDDRAVLLALNWTPYPGWLTLPAPVVAHQAEQSPGGAEEPQSASGGPSEPPSPPATPSTEATQNA